MTENPRPRSGVIAAAPPPRRAASAQQRLAATALQEVYARKRETEQLRSEKNSAVAQYFDKWGRITSRFENWTAPEYYEKSDHQLRVGEEEKKKEQDIQQRREKLRTLYNEEKEAWEKEIKEKERAKVRPGSAAPKHNVDVLQRLHTSLSDQERRRKEIEATLFSRWRFGMTRDDLILESKNHHQAMAKLNWLDQQVKEQLERDRQEKEQELLKNKSQSEKLREEELALEARKSQEREVAELKKMLEFHYLELKARDEESKALKERNATLKDVRLGLQIKEQEVANIFASRKAACIPMHNLRRLKVMALDHCQVLSEEIAQDGKQLEAIKELLRGHWMSPKEEQHFQLLALKFDQEQAELQKDVDNLTTMYDSEVKGTLLKQQCNWKQSAETRCRLLKNLINELTDKCDVLITSNVEEIAALVKIKENHLKAIDDLNDQLQGVTNGQGRRQQIKEDEPSALTDLPFARKLPQKFVSVGETLDVPRHAPPDETEGATGDASPRFGRKKFAWY